MPTPPRSRCLTPTKPYRAVVPPTATVQTYLGNIKRRGKEAPRLQGPARNSKGKCSARNIVAMVPVARLLNNAKAKARLSRALEAAAEFEPNLSMLTKPELQMESSSLRVDVKIAEAGQQQAEAGERSAQACKRKAEAALGELQKEKASEMMQKVKVVVEKLKQKRRDKAKEVRDGEQRKATARVEGQLTNANRLRNEANAKKRTAVEALAVHEKVAEDRLQKLKDSDHELSAAKAKIDEYREHLSVPPAIKPRVLLRCCE